MRMIKPNRTIQPELTYNPRFRNGIAVCSFSIYLQPEAMVVHEWRGGLGNRRIGPRLVFRPDRLMIGEDETFLTPVPSDEWVYVEIECGLGRYAQVPAIFKVTVSIEQTPEPFEGLPCVSRRFRALDQCVFLGRVEEEESHSLDNIRIALR